MFNSCEILRGGDTDILICIAALLSKIGIKYEKSK